MPNIIDSSWQNPTLKILSRSKEITIIVRHSRNLFEYKSNFIDRIHELNSDSYRNAGGAAAGAIVGGVLTGGVGLLAGAAYGGRRRKKAAYLIEFTDGRFIAFETSTNSEIESLDSLINKKLISEIRNSNTQIKIESDPIDVFHTEESKDNSVLLTGISKKSRSKGSNYLVVLGIIGIISALIFLILGASSAKLAFISMALIWTIFYMIFKIFSFILRSFKPVEKS